MYQYYTGLPILFFIKNQKKIKISINIIVEFRYWYFLSKLFHFYNFTKVKIKILLRGCPKSIKKIWKKKLDVLSSKIWSHWTSEPAHRGAFCQFPFRLIHYCHNSKSTGKKTVKMHLCAAYYIEDCWILILLHRLY